MVPNLFPSVLVAKISLHIINVVLLGISCVIFPQGPHQDHGDKTHQEDDHHERVEDGEPVNLKQNHYIKKTVSV